ncbi:MAG: WG repeat-containing protein, partial [Bacteroidota bacterium]
KESDIKSEDDQPKTRSYIFKKRILYVGIIDHTGKMVIDCIYNSLKYQPAYDLIIANYEGLHGIIDKTGNVILPFNDKYIYIDDFDENGIATIEFIYTYKSKFGLVDTSGKIITDDWYDIIHKFVNGFARVKNDELLGAINLNGQLVVEVKYTVMSDFNPKGLAGVGLNKSYGIVDSNGLEIIPLCFNGISDQDGNFLVYFGNESAVVDYNGNCIDEKKKDSYKAHLRNYFNKKR